MSAPYARTTLAGSGPSGAIRSVSTRAAASLSSGKPKIPPLPEYPVGHGADLLHAAGTDLGFRYAERAEKLQVTAAADAEALGQGGHFGHFGGHWLTPALFGSSFSAFGEELRWLVTIATSSFSVTRDFEM